MITLTIIYFVRRYFIQARKKQAERLVTNPVIA